MVDGNGAASAQGIDSVLEWNQIKDKQKQSYKLLVYIATALRVKSEERQKNGGHQTKIHN